MDDKQIFQSINLAEKLEEGKDSRSIGKDDKNVYSYDIDLNLKPKVISEISFGEEEKNENLN